MFDFSKFLRFGNKLSLVFDTTLPFKIKATSWRRVGEVKVSELFGFKKKPPPPPHTPTKKPTQGVQDSKE